jgi:TM2 domain-containing membrane protein YozV
MSAESSLPGAENPPQPPTHPADQPTVPAPYPPWGDPQAQQPNVIAPYSPPASPPPPGWSTTGGGYPVPGQYTQGMPLQQGQPMIVPKNPALGVILSFFIPGLGSIVNGSVGLGVAIMACYFVSWLFALILIGIPFVIGTWIWGLVDGYLSAQRWNRAHGIIS